MFSKEAFTHLKLAYAVLLSGIAVTAFLIAGSYFYWQQERKNDAGSAKSLTEMRTRLDAARRERDDLRDSAETFRMLTTRGMFLPEERLDLIEGLGTLKVRHRLYSLNYDIGSQRPLKLFGGTPISGVLVKASRVRIKAEALHDGDLISFLDDFPKFQRGLFPMDRCTIKRLTGASSIVPAAGATDTAVGGAELTKGGLEAECTMEWITLVDPNAAGRVSPAPPPASAKK